MGRRYITKWYKLQGTEVKREDLNKESPDVSKGRKECLPGHISIVTLCLVYLALKADVRARPMAEFFLSIRMK